MDLSSSFHPEGGELEPARPQLISLLKRTELSKSSTLTRMIKGSCIVLHPPRGADDHRQRGFQGEERESMLFGSEERSPLVTSWAVAIDLIASAALVVCG